MRSVRLLARGLKYAALALQLPADERDWSGERMLRHVLGVGPRRFWWLDLVSNPIVIGVELLVAIPAAHQAPDFFAAGLLVGFAVAPALLIGGEG